MVHAEDPWWLAPAMSSRRYAHYLASRPVAAERAAIEILVGVMAWRPAPVLIVHLSSASSIDIVRKAKQRGLPLTVETCPHYLTFVAEEIPDGATEYKCAPPIREAAEREALWDALLAGDIDLVASDHSPCPPAMKGTDGDFSSAWGGIASLQLSLAAVWTAARTRGAGVERIAKWMSAGPAKLAGLGARKGAIAPGQDADIVIWNPDTMFTVDSSRLEHRHKLTPYAGRTLYGEVLATYVGGRAVFTTDRPWT
jgi:allantoinase